MNKGLIVTYLRDIKTGILNSLSPYPEAGKAVLEAIKKQEEG